MRILYFDCGMGTAGDMLSAALLDCLEEPSAFVNEFNGIGIPGVEMMCEEAETCGIRGRRVLIRVHGHEEDCCDDGKHEHHHDHELKHIHGELTAHQQRGLEEVLQIIGGLPLSETVLKDSVSIYRSIPLLKPRQRSITGRLVKSIFMSWDCLTP